MKAVIHDEKELGRALNDNAIEIEIADPKLAGHITRIKATGAVAWAVAIGAIGVAVVAILAAPATAGTSAAVGAVMAAPAVGILGAGTVTSAIAIAVAAGGTGVLNKLRNYRCEKRDGKIVLVKK